MITVAGIQRVPVDVQVSERDIVQHMQSIIRARHNIRAGMYLDDAGRLCLEAHDSRLPDEIVRAATESEIGAFKLLSALMEYV